MNLLDWIILIWLGLAFFSGMRFGLVYRLGHLIGLILGIYLAGKYYSVIGHWLGNSPWSLFGTFQVILIGVSMLGGIIASVLNKIFNFVSWIPFLKTANRLLGGVFGLITNTIIISIIIFFLSRIQISPVLTQTLVESKFAGVFLQFGNILSIFLPGEITSLQKLF